MEITEWSFMRRSSKKQPFGLTKPAIDQHDSLTIQNLIEQLDRDLKQSQRKATKAH